MVMALTVVCGCVVSPDPQYASAKTVSKVTKVVTLNKNNEAFHMVSVKENESVVTKVNN